MALPASRSRVDVGATTVAYLPDGYGWLNPQVFFPDSRTESWSTYEGFLDEHGRFPVSVGAFLVRTPERVVLVDLGLGRVDFAIPDVADFHGGDLLDSLAAEGLAPRDVDIVVYTHLHHDHVGWTTDIAPAPNAPAGRTAGGLTFENAVHLVREPEWAHWHGTAELVGPDPEAVQRPLETAIRFVADHEEIAPGVEILATPGHTPGHSSLLITDPTGADPRRVIILGDTLHCQVQVRESDWMFAFDVDPELAAVTRKRLLAELEDEHTLTAGGHFADTVFGRVLPGRSWAEAAG